MNDVKDIKEHKYLFHEGRNFRSYEFLGAHLLEEGAAGQAGESADGNAAGAAGQAGEGADGSAAGQGAGEGADGSAAGAAGQATGDAAGGGVVFRVFAPRAEAVSLVGDFNYWDEGADPMQRLEDDPSIWELTLPRAKKGDKYKFAIKSDTGKVVQKADPYAFFSETGNADHGSQRASIVYGLDDGFDWGDDEWLRQRAAKNPYRSAMNIYELHLGSWMRKPDGSIHTYRETADMLIPYVKDMGYTHIELLPIMEYPFDGSWGYQATGYFSPTARYGTPADLKYLIDLAHRSGIGVLMDWVPAHFAKDEHGLIEFDGHPLYEDSNPYRMEHKGWGTRAFDFGRPEVLSFLISNAFYYCDQFHMDGLRVDAVAAMLYLDYDREDGEWSPNSEGGRENMEAINFLQNMNRDVLSNFPGVVTVAEESTAWPGITLPPDEGGLGFNFKWNMGWMNDELSYFSADPFFRKGRHNELVFSLDYVWGENYILPVSHDEVVHGKKSLIDKMAGEYDDKFRQIKAFFCYMFAHPGKKLNFMGNEFGQFLEWSEEREIDWPLLQYETHRKLKDFVHDLNRLYLETPQLYALDNETASFCWISGEDVNNNVISFMRYGEPEEEQPLVFTLNMSGNDIKDYMVGVPDAGRYRVLIDTDDPKYGGGGMRTGSADGGGDANGDGGDQNRQGARVYTASGDGWNGFDHSIRLDLPKFSGIMLVKE